MADAQADNERTYDQGMTAAKKTLADALSTADQALADTVDAAAQVRDDAIADAQKQCDDALADAEQTWTDSYEAATSAEEQTNAAAYAPYIAAVTAAGVALDDAASAADVAQDEADAAAGVAWTDTVDAAWEQQQLADAAAAVQWDQETTAADSAALDAARQDNEACNNAEMSAWQQQVDAVLSAAGSDVHSWAEQTGTRYAHLLDVEMAAWVQGTASDAAADVADAEADYNAETDKTVAEAKADDAESDAEDANAQVAVQTEADAAVADAHDEAQAAADDVTAVDTAWQADEHAATVDAAAHDNDEATAAVTDANADQGAADAWEKTEAPAAAADQKAVDAADDQAAHNQDAAVKSGNDQIAQDQKNQQNKDADAAQAHDTQVATVSHDSVVQKASAADAAIQAAADAAAGQVQAEVAPAPAALVAAVNAALSDAQAKNADQTAKSIDVADTQRAALLTQVQNQVNANVQSAQQGRDIDAARSLDDLVIAQVNPPPPQSGWQTFLDFFPSWKTVAMVGVGVGLGAVALLVPGVGPVLFAVGMGMLAVSSLSSAADRGFNQGQTVLQSLGGGLADATGVSAAYTGWTGEDLATGRHLGLTAAQQRQMLTEGTIQTGLLLYGGVRGARSFLRGRQPAAQKGTTEPPTPPQSSAGSNAGKAGSAQQAQVQTACFVAGTLIRLLYGCKAIERILIGDRVLSRDQYNPSAAVVEQVVEEVFVRLAPVVRLTVGGRELRPTGEHPFYVPGRGWVLAWSLRRGDMIQTLSGEPVMVEDMVDAGAVVRVYNFRVRELQTYFVGGDDWGFAVWSHNTNGHQAGSSGSKGAMPDPQVIKGIKALPAGAKLTPTQIAELNKNIDVILSKTLPAKAASARGNVQDVANLFKNDPRFRFLDQVPDALERIEAALQQYGGSLK